MTDLSKLDEWKFVYADAKDGSVFRLEMLCNGELMVSRNFDTRAERECYVEALQAEAVRMGGTLVPPYKQ